MCENSFESIPNLISTCGRIALKRFRIFRLSFLPFPVVTPQTLPTINLIMDHLCEVKPPPQLNYAICFNTLWQHQYWSMLSDQHLVVLSLYNVLFQKNLTTSDELTHFAWILSSRFQLRLNHQLYLQLLSIELLSINFKHIHHHRVYNVTKIDPDKEWVRKHEGSRHSWY